MSETKTLILGLIAGGTIVLGLPLGRLRTPRPQLRHFLNAIAIGVLLFLVWDVLSGAFEPLDAALSDLHANTGGFAPVLGYSALFFGGLTVGLMGLVYYERWMQRERTRDSTLRASSLGAATAIDLAPVHGLASWSANKRLALLIAVG